MQTTERYNSKEAFDLGRINLRVFLLSPGALNFLIFINKQGVYSDLEKEND